jgi:hypothetical protein
VTEDAGFVNCQVIQDVCQFLFAFFADEQAVLAVERFQVALFQAALQAVLKEVSAARIEVHAALLVDEGLQEPQFGLGDLRV